MYVFWLDHTTRGPSREGDGHEGREYPVLNGVSFLCCKEGVCQWQPSLCRIASSLYRLTDSGVQGGEWLVCEQATTGQVSNHTVTDSVYTSQSLSSDETWNDKSTSEVLGMHANNRQMSTKPVQKSSIDYADSTPHNPISIC